MKKNSGILILIMILAIGFASVSTNLIVNGTGVFVTNEEDFKVIFSEAIIDGIDVSETVISEDGQTLEFTTSELAIKGETSELLFEVTNNSKQYDASITMECVANGEHANDYYKIEKTIPENITANTKENGSVIVKLLRTSVEKIEETFTCTIQASAEERTVVAKSIYNAIGTLLDSENDALSNVNLVAYSETPQYVTTNDAGDFKLIGLEEGSHAIYYVENKTIDELKQMTKEEIINAASMIANFDTSTSQINVQNAFAIKAFKISEEDLEMTDVKLLSGDGITPGDEIAIGKEHFYLISNDGENARIMAKYNLYVGTTCAGNVTSCPNITDATGLQKKEALGQQDTGNRVAVTVFSNASKKGTNYSSYDGSLVESYVDTYVNYLNSTYNLNISGNLITKEELETLEGKTLGVGSTFSTDHSWLYRTTYWTMSSVNSTYIWAIYYDNTLDDVVYNDNNGFGVRPVLTIPSIYLK